MNPIMKMLQSSGNQSQPNVSEIIGKLKSIDPHQKSLEMIQHLNADQKAAVIKLLPKIQQLGKVFGAPDKDITSFVSELTQYCQK